MRDKKNSSYNNYNHYKITLFGIVGLLFFHSLSPIFAQLPDFSIATTYKVEEKEVKDGDIMSISSEKELLVRSDKAYDERMFGVYVEHPKLVYRSPDTNLPLVRQGEVDVNVTDFNGDIVRGDYVTSSPLPGFGQKATEVSGYILGVALESFDKEKAAEIEYQNKKYLANRVRVSIGIGPASPVIFNAPGGLFGTLRNISGSFFYTISTSKRAERIFRYALATLVAVLTLYISFHTFGKNITQGIESIGRNPLAKSTIQSMIVVNIVLIAVVTLGGIILSLVIISL